MEKSHGAVLEVSMGVKSDLFSIELGKRFKQKHMALGLDYGQLGAMLGYRNLSKASRRIRSWEAGTELPTEYRERYLAALQMTEADVDALRLELSDELSEKGQSCCQSSSCKLVFIRH